MRCPFALVFLVLPTSTGSANKKGKPQSTHPRASNRCLQVTFAAYLAVLLGTFVPVAFLIILYIQSESRKAGEAAGRGE